jgi:hypothetical protein
LYPCGHRSKLFPTQRLAILKEIVVLAAVELIFLEVHERGEPRANVAIACLLVGATGSCKMFIKLSFGARLIIPVANSAIEHC